MTEHDMTRDKLAQLAKYMLALVTGAVILFPSIDSSFRPPYVWNPVLYLFWLFALLSLGFLGFAYYTSNFVKGKAPQRTAGIGNWLALIALCLLVLYVGTNLYSDRTSPLQITALTAEPREGKPGEWVKFSAEVGASDSEGAQWSWYVRPRSGKEQSRKLLGKSKVAYWQVPKQELKKEPYIITASVEDSQGRRVAYEELEFFPKGDKAMTAKEEEKLRPYLQDKVSLELARRARETPAKARLLSTAQETLVDLATSNLHSIEAVIQDPKALEQALEAYLSIPESELEAGVRPCCTKYPGTWPFCDPSC